MKTRFGDLLSIQARAKPYKSRVELNDAVRKALYKHDRILLDVGRRAYAGIPAWYSLEHWVTYDAPLAYDLYYNRIRHLIGADGTTRKHDIAKATFLKIVAAHAVYADFRTGRNCRPSIGLIAEMTGHQPRTITRARMVMVHLGLATEILRGRKRKLTERLASHRVGDSSQGWASVFALHQALPVDRKSILAVDKSAGQDLAAIHLGERPLGRTSSVIEHSLPHNSSAGELKGRATHDPGLDNKRRSRPTANKEGLLLASRWRQNARTPAWARRHSPAAWSHVLAKPAAHGWTDRDLNQLLRDYIGGLDAAGQPNWIAANPHRPIALLAKLLNWHGDLEDRPAAADDAREAEAARDRVARTTCTLCDEHGWQLPYRDDLAVRCAHE